MLRACILNNLAYDFGLGSLDDADEIMLNQVLECGGEFAQGFAYMVREYGRKKLTNPTLFTAPKCQFHVHAQTKRCVK
jgi:hypothetical protein